MSQLDSPSMTRSNSADYNWMRAFIWTLFSFSGRINRSVYFGTCLLVYIVGPATYFLSAALLDSGIFTISKPIDWSAGFNFDEPGPLIVAGVIFFWMGLATGSKRCHDFGYSGFLLILQAIPYLGWIAGLVILFAGGTSGANNYGQGPGWENRPAALVRR